MLVMPTLGVSAQTSMRETILLVERWKFAFGLADNPKKHFGCGTDDESLRHDRLFPARGGVSPQQLGF